MIFDFWYLSPISLPRVQINEAASPSNAESHAEAAPQEPSPDYRLKRGEIIRSIEFTMNIIL